MVAIMVDVSIASRFSNFCVFFILSFIGFAAFILYHDAVCSELVQSYARSNLNLVVTS
jgi:hypothetical protein